MKISIEKGFLTPLSRKDIPRVASVLCDKLPQDYRDSFFNGVLFHWKAISEAKMQVTCFLFVKGKQTLLPVIQHQEKNVFISWPPELGGDQIKDILIHSSCSIIKESHQTVFQEQEWAKNEVISVPALGESHSLWADGWLSHKLADGSFVSLIPPGNPIRLQTHIPAKDVGKTWDELAEFFPLPLEILRQSLVSRIRVTSPENLSCLYLENFSLEEAVALLLYRQAFPHLPLTLCHMKEPKEWPSPWKRYLEFIEGRRVPYDPSSFPVKRITALLPQDLNPLVEELNRYTQILAPIMP